MAEKSSASAPRTEQISLYKMYRELQAENVRLKAENTLLQSLVESWTSRFEKILQSDNRKSIKNFPK
ncbi:hypothetical protein EB118_20395 [bacterium]|nr:hypothetical protein [Actinomycetota bacterium]NDG32421.1 hypothetical protein [bacterium]